MKTASIVYEPEDWAGDPVPMLAIIRSDDDRPAFFHLGYYRVNDITPASQRRLLAALVSMGAVFELEDWAFTWDNYPQAVRS